MKSFGVAVLLMALLSFALLLGPTGGRPLHIVKDHDSGSGGNVAWDLDQWLTLGAVKGGGPSPGAGHRFITDGGIKNSGPSPGDGHRYVTSNHH
ncbi:hypothetical protein DM860_014507 [Cuscuta australis]|uniref:Uncharacterized protein n=1 Tax=Cuscuta australis TaxID=267555 RepID=A0A328DXV4_9ASTE|nr:hypothetical protein DM860_014507 [Cuscuta australis]